jgi:ribosomal protein S18 acetylase RimI-like enzyme
VVGVLLVTYEWSDWRNGRVWWIQSVYVAPAQRGQGVYSGLYRYVKGLVEKDSKARGLRLYVNRSNNHAQKVYEALGMSKEHYELYEWMKTF